MRWIAPTEKDSATVTLEKRLWDAADQLRANSGLTAAQYATPILGLIFLRFAEASFNARRGELKAIPTSARRGSRVEEPAEYHASGVLYLQREAQFEYLLTLPQGADIGAKVNAAMRSVERTNPKLVGVLPKTYNVFSNDLLKDLLKKMSEIPVTIDYDVFGRIYEYFLAEFAMTQGQGGGEFYTPSPIVRLLVEIIEPYKGKILDPACGSGGMFVQSANFVSAHHGRPASDLSIYGIEKVDATGALCRMNLAIHGLEGDIRHGGQTNSYYDDPFKATGTFDFVLANPPFNVDGVNKERLAGDVGPSRRFPFGLPKADNANYMWISMFYSALNERGRAGFVMASGAEGGSTSAAAPEIRKSLVEADAVDVMIAVGTNMFYTVVLPCTLWFLDRAKTTTSRAGKTLFIDARGIYRQVDRAHRDWTDVQIGFIASIVRLYRGESLDLSIGGDDVRRKIEEVFGETPTYIDVPGLCKVATREEIEAQDWSLSPGRYVGVARVEEFDDEDFAVHFRRLSDELSNLINEGRDLERKIATNVSGILGS